MHCFQEVLFKKKEGKIMLNLGLILNKLMERLKIQGNSLHYVGGNDVLPPPLSKEEEEKLLLELLNGN